MCDNSRMFASWQRVVGVALGVAGVGGCATQQGTSQALTVVGAAAVVVGASMAADTQCYGAASEGPASVDCARNTSKGVRNAGKGLAVAGVGLAAAGYALKPKGPDNMQRARPDPDAAPASPYRLIRREPLPEPEPELPAEVSPVSAAGTPEGAATASESEATPPAAEPVEPPSVPVEPPAACRNEGATGSAATGACPREKAAGGGG